ncbi:hypothetical protein J2T13_005189 [Paenibacillus sp. DS2015]
MAVRIVGFKKLPRSGLVQHSITTAVAMLPWSPGGSFHRSKFR